MMNPEVKPKIIEALEKKRELLEKLNHNKKEVRNLEALRDAAVKADVINKIDKEIRKGRGLISIQTTALSKMSSAKIASRYNASKFDVNYQWKSHVGIML